MKVILDTNVILAAAYCTNAVPHRSVLDLLADGEYEIALTLPLFLEYPRAYAFVRESTIARGVKRSAAIDVVYQDLACCSSRSNSKAFFMSVLGCVMQIDDTCSRKAAVASGAADISLHINIRDFDKSVASSRRFGISILKPQNCWLCFRREKTENE